MDSLIAKFFTLDLGASNDASLDCIKELSQAVKDENQRSYVNEDFLARANLLFFKTVENLMSDSGGDKHQLLTLCAEILLLLRNAVICGRGTNKILCLFQSTIEQLPELVCELLKFSSAESVRAARLCVQLICNWLACKPEDSQCRQLYDNIHHLIMPLLDNTGSGECNSLSDSCCAMLLYFLPHVPWWSQPDDIDSFLPKVINLSEGSSFAMLLLSRLFETEGFLNAAFNCFNFEKQCLLLEELEACCMSSHWPCADSLYCLREHLMNCGSCLVELASVDKQADSKISSQCRVLRLCLRILALCSSADDVCVEVYQSSTTLVYTAIEMLKLLEEADPAPLPRRPEAGSSSLGEEARGILRSTEDMAAAFLDGVEQNAVAAMRCDFLCIISTASYRCERIQDFVASSGFIPQILSLTSPRPGHMLVKERSELCIRNLTEGNPRVQQIIKDILAAPLNQK